MVAQTMKRYVLAHRNGPDGLRLETDAPVPNIQSPTQVLIKVHALSLNARDIQIAQNQYPAPHAIPDNLVPVSDGSGEVVAIGEGVTRFKVGDRVSPIVFSGNHHEEDATLAHMNKGLGGAIDGLAQEYVISDEQDLVHIPRSYTHEQASTLTIAYSTAWSCLYGHYPKLQSGQTVLCLGTGGVSLAAAQIALISGANVILTSSSQGKLDRAKEILKPLIGDKKDVLQFIDYSKIDRWDEEAKKLNGGRGVDFVIEISGQGTIARSIRSTRQGGLVAICGYLTNYSKIPQEIIEEDIAQTILYSAAYVRGVFVCNRAEEEKMIRALEVGQVQPVIDRVFDFDQLKDAYQYMVDGKHFGKVVIKL